VDHSRTTRHGLSYSEPEAAGLRYLPDQPPDGPGLGFVWSAAPLLDLAVGEDQPALPDRSRVPDLAVPLDPGARAPRCQGKPMGLVCGVRARRGPPVHPCHPRYGSAALPVSPATAFRDANSSSCPDLSQCRLSAHSDRGQRVIQHVCPGQQCHRLQCRNPTRRLARDTLTLCFQIYQAYDAPLYRNGNKILLALVTWNIVFIIAIKFYYKWRNARREKIWAGMSHQERDRYLSTTKDTGSKRLDFRFAH